MICFDTHEMPDQKIRVCELLILGAGCAGTRLAAHLERLGYSSHVALLDARTDWSASARWCSWGAPGLPPLSPDLGSLVSHRWHEWQTRDAARTARCQSDETRYYQIDAPPFFAHFHARWRDPNGATTLHLGERVVQISEDSNGVTVLTRNRQNASERIWRAPVVFDARHAGSGALDKLEAPGHLRLHQDFVGWIVESARPMFEPQCTTLMDFRLRQPRAQDGLAFAYVLPFSPTRALVESTHFGAALLPAEAHEAALRDYLRVTLRADDYHIVARERGDLPMASAVLPERPGQRVFAIGVAGGAARAASGYAFARIEAQTARLARAIVRGDVLEGGGELRGAERRARHKSAALDATFLEIIAHQPALARRCFVDLFARVPPATLARFLSEGSSLADDARIIAALPKLPFCAATARRISARITGQMRVGRKRASDERASELNPANPFTAA